MNPSRIRLGTVVALAGVFAVTALLWLSGCANETAPVVTNAVSTTPPPAPTGAAQPGTQPGSAEPATAANTTAGQTASEPKPSAPVKIERDKNGKAKPVLVDENGRPIPITPGSGK